MTFVHDLVLYLTQIWHEFAKAVHLEAKQGKGGFWNKIFMYLVSIPIGGVLLALGLTVLFVGIMMTVPIAKLFGYDLGFAFAKSQAKYQDKLRPSMWIPFLAKMHSNRQTWSSIEPAATIFKDIVAAVKHNKGTKKETFEIIENDQKNMYIKVYVFSPKMKYLDVVEIKCDVGEDMGGATVDAFSFSSGIAPLSLPPFVALFMNLCLFWMPFSDGNKNKQRLNDIRSAMHHEIHLAPAVEVAAKGKSE